MKNQKRSQEILTKETLNSLYDELGSCRAVGKKLAFNGQTIKRHMQNLRLSVKKQVRYSCDEDFFSRDTEESFYLAGFIAADGCIKQRGNSYQLSIGLAVADLNHLQLIKKLLKATNPIHIYKIENDIYKNGYVERCELVIVSKKIFNDLGRFNITPRKTKTYIFPDWIENHHLSHHFLRGYFDGDGSIYYSVNKNKFTDQLGFNILGTLNFVQKYKFILEKELNQKIGCLRQRSGIYSFDCGGNILVGKIAKYLYRNSNIFLKRKYDISIIGIKHHEEYIINQYFKEISNFKSSSFKYITNPRYPELSKENLKKEYLKNSSIIGLARIFHKRAETIKKKLIEYDIDIISFTPPTKEQLEKACTNFNSISEISRNLNYSRETIEKYIEIYNIFFTTERRTHLCSDDFFSKNKESKEQFYWAGFFMYNSHISKNTIIITSKNFDLVNRLSKTNITERSISKNNEYYNMKITSSEIILDLKNNFNIDSNKKIEYYFPNELINHKYFRYFLQGAIGSDKILKSMNKNFIEICGCEKYLLQLRDFFKKTLNLNNSASVRKRSGKEQYRLTYTGNSLKKVLNYLSADILS